MDGSLCGCKYCVCVCICCWLVNCAGVGVCVCVYVASFFKKGGPSHIQAWRQYFFSSLCLRSLVTTHPHTHTHSHTHSPTYRDVPTHRHTHTIFPAICCASRIIITHHLLTHTHTHTHTHTLQVVRFRLGVDTSAQALRSMCEAITIPSDVAMGVGGTDTDTHTQEKAGKNENGFATFHEGRHWIDLAMACLCVCCAALASGEDVCLCV